MFEANSQDKQGEFFNDLPSLTEKPKKKKFNLGKIAISLSYENLIVLAIGLIMLLIVCYSLGVEKGKSFVQGDIERMQQEQAQQPPSREVPEPEPRKERTEVASDKQSLKTSPYIQVASFRTDKYAKKEMESLKNKGYRPFVTTWGKFRVVCVGGYKDKDQARKALKQLRKLYADCILHNN